MTTKTLPLLDPHLPTATWGSASLFLFNKKGLILLKHPSDLHSQGVGINGGHREKGKEEQSDYNGVFPRNPP